MFVLVCNVYALITWSVRLSSSTQQYNFIHSRLARTSRPEIPRFRFEFKHATRDVGDHVHKTLVDAFLNDYLESDGYFFIRLLSANSSDFIVQEILEQLWAVYIMKYGEKDAREAERSYFEFRRRPSPIVTIHSNPLHITPDVNPTNGTKYSKSKPEKEYSSIGIGLLSASSVFEPINDEPNEQV